MHRTAEELSPEELNQYRLRLSDHFQNRDSVDEALLHRAWQTAYRLQRCSMKTSEQHKLQFSDRLLNRIGFQEGRISILLSGGSQLTVTLVQSRKQ